MLLNALSTKLPQVMIEVFVPHTGPFVWSEKPEKAVRVCSASFWTSSDELLHVINEVLLFHGKVSLVCNDEGLVGGHIPFDRFRT